MTPHLSRLVETVQMWGHDICFYAELTKIIPNYHKILPLSRAMSGLIFHLVFWFCFCGQAVVVAVRLVNMKA